MESGEGDTVGGGGLFMCSCINLCQSVGQYCLWFRPLDVAVND